MLSSQVLDKFKKIPILMNELFDLYQLPYCRENHLKWISANENIVKVLSSDKDSLSKFFLSNEHLQWTEEEKVSFLDQLYKVYVDILVVDDKLFPITGMRLASFLAPFFQGSRYQT
jgi:hypothetical protein